MKKLIEALKTAWHKYHIIICNNAVKKRPKSFRLDMGNTNIPIQYRLAYMQMTVKERDEFLDAYWQDVQNGLEYTKQWQ